MDTNSNQDLHYEMLEKLQLMAKELPRKYQQCVSYNDLFSLAQLLLDNTVFEIVKELKDLQLVTEKHLYQTRQVIVNRQRVEMDGIIKNHREELLKTKCQGRSHAVERLQLLHAAKYKETESRHNIELSNYNQQILSIIDEKAEEQQSTLEQVGIPCFRVTKDQDNIKVQMYILDFITKLGSIG